MRDISERHPKQSRVLRVCLCLLLPLFLMACKEPLYSSLDEIQVNEMLAVLEGAGIQSDRTRDKDGNYALNVEKDDIAAAVIVLRREGYPKRRFATLGDVFPNEGIVGTPFEERARFMFALNEELSHTISEIDGVRSARVQVMIPAPERFGDVIRPASAAVALHYERAFEPSRLVPTIKTLVEHSVPDLEYENVTVALFQAGGAQMVQPPLFSAAPAGATADASEKPGVAFASLVPSLNRLATLWKSSSAIILACLGLILCLICIAVVLFQHRPRGGFDAR